MWGVGRAGLGKPDYNGYAAALERLSLVGVRDFGTKFDFVPCVSCLHYAFDNGPDPEHDLVIYEHRHHPISGPGGIPRLRNDCSSAEEAIGFLASGRTVVTSSYHGAYWAMLLGRRVAIIPPWSAKFHRFEKAPGVWTDGDLSQAERVAVDYSAEGLLERYRDLNRRFHGRVMERLSQASGQAASLSCHDVR